MSKREKVAQLLFPFTRVERFSPGDEEYERLVYFVRELKVGGLHFLPGNDVDILHLSNELQSISDIPLLITSDLESGIGKDPLDSLHFPSAMALGATRDTGLVYAMGRMLALKARSLGIHINFAPVADLNNNPDNPVINTRSFGENTELVSSLAGNLMRGLQQEGVLSTAKHFPGHGNTNTDSHHDLPVIKGSQTQLFRYELQPFSSLINKGIMGVMSAHIGLEAFNIPDTPATLSPSVINGVLKQKLGFKGLVFTDALNMKAITEYYSPADAGVKALLAGNDVLLFPVQPDSVINGILSALDSGIISLKRIEHSVRKILLVKRWAGLHKNRFSAPLHEYVRSLNEKNFEISKQLAEKSITLLKNKNNILPLSPESKKKFLHVVFYDPSSEKAAVYFSNELLKRENILDAIFISSANRRFNLAPYKNLIRHADGYIISCFWKASRKSSASASKQKQELLLKSFVNSPKEKIFIAHADPYLIKNFPKTDVYMTGFGTVRNTSDALIKALYGYIPVTGKLPITIPGSGFRAGSGITINRSRLSSGEHDSLRIALSLLLEKAILDSAFPGGVVLAALNGEVKVSLPFGAQTYSASSPKITEQSIYDLASLTKVIATSTSAMICVDRKLFSLDDKISRFFPELKKDNNKRNITIRHLLLHRSGLPAFKQFYKTLTSKSEIIADILKSDLQFKPGKKTQYSDLGMILLGVIIEKVTGQSLDTFCRREIFSPLKLRNIMFNPPDSLLYRIVPTEIDNYWRNKLIHGKVHDETAWLMNGVAGHAGLFSTAEDLLVILQMLMQKGTYGGVNIVSPETVKMFTTRFDTLSDKALGWETRGENTEGFASYFSSSSYGHTGFTGTMVWSDPKSGLIIVFLTNRVYPTRENQKIRQYRKEVCRLIDYYLIKNKMQ